MTTIAVEKVAVELLSSSVRRSTDTYDKQTDSHMYTTIIAEDTAAGDAAADGGIKWNKKSMTILSAKRFY